MGQVTLIQGEDREINFTVIDSEDSIALDLTGATEISVKIAATSGGAVIFLMSNSEVIVTEAVKGKFKVIMSDTNTSLIKIGDQSVEVIIDIGTNRRIVQLEKALSIKKKLF
jgi:hypothetical protein